MTISLLDLMSDEERITVRKWAKERLAPKYPHDIPVPFYTMAELNHYYGWEAVRELKRGYHIGIDENGKRERVEFTFEEASALIEAARKIEYRASKLQ